MLPQRKPTILDSRRSASDRSQTGLPHLTIHDLTILTSYTGRFASWFFLSRNALANVAPVSPRDVKELAEFLAGHHARTEKAPAIDLSQMNRVLELAPEDMTVTVEAGITLAALQLELARHRQWLPIDPPRAERLSIRELLANDLSGPRRFGYGTIREHLIGMKVLLADGRIIKSGGKVVKNVAGYDLAKLFIGARDSLGIIVEATFKLRPLPEIEEFFCAHVSLDDLSARLRTLLESPVTPMVMDAYPSNGQVTMVVGFAGTRAEVEWQRKEAAALGFSTALGSRRSQTAATGGAETLEYDLEFWEGEGAVRKVSVLPSRIILTLMELRERPWIARLGNGVIYYRGEPLPRRESLPRELMRRVKATYDANNIFPEFTT
jgi:glycolate oxidase FAD binding subunit